MKRKNFKIEFEKDGVTQTVIKHAWNAANKEVVSIVRQIARNQGQFYEVIQSESERASDYYDGFIKGTRTWQGRSTGQKLFFKIEKVD